MSIARSTPAQNDRGPANTTDRDPARSAHTRSDGPIRRSTRSAFAPAPTVRNRPNGVYAVSTITRTTATGRSRVGRARTTADPGHHDCLRSKLGDPRHPGLHALHSHAAPLDQRTWHLPG